MKKIDWDRPVCTKHIPPLIGDLCGMDAQGRRLVNMPSLSQRPDLAVKSPTTYHYDDSGSCHVMGDANDHDLVNFDPSDNVVRMRLEGSR